MTDMPQVRTILIVEDDDVWARSWERALQGKVNFVWASSLAEGERLFRETPGIVLIVMDACVDNGGERPDSMPLTRRIRETFAGPMIAASRSHKYRRMLLHAGCNYEVSEEGDKADVPHLVMKLLG
ncbi:MAG: response regulator [Parcubacteria group bacterium]